MNLKFINVALELTEQFAKTLEDKKHILITFNESGAGDDIGSALAMLLFLEAMGKKAEIVCPDFNLPAGYSFLQKSSDIKPAPGHLQKFIVTIDVTGIGVQELSYDIQDDKLRIFITPKHGYLTRERMKTAESDFVYDLIVVLDTPDLDSLGTIYTLHTDFFSRVPIVNIDHSSSNEHFGHLNIVDITKSSTAELLYTLFEKIKPEYITKEIATALLTGMIAKTHSFTKGNIRPQALTVASKLVELGADRSHIIKNLFQTKSIGTFKLWGVALSHLQHDESIGLVWTTLTRDDFTRAGGEHTDLPAIIDELIVNAPSARLILFLHEDTSPQGESIIQGLLRADFGYDAKEILLPYQAHGNREYAEFSVRGKTLKEVEEELVGYIRKKVTSNEK